MTRYDEHLAKKGCLTVAMSKKLKKGDLLWYFEPGGPKHLVEFDAIGTSAGSPVARIKKGDSYPDVYYHSLKLLTEEQLLEVLGNEADES